MGWDSESRRSWDWDWAMERESERVCEEGASWLRGRVAVWINSECPESSSDGRKKGKEEEETEEKMESGKEDKKRRTYVQGERGEPFRTAPRTGRHGHGRPGLYTYKSGVERRVGVGRPTAVYPEAEERCIQKKDRVDMGVALNYAGRGRNRYRGRRWLGGFKQDRGWSIGVGVVSFRRWRRCYPMQKTVRQATARPGTESRDETSCGELSRGSCAR
ncbi:hypothetical protein C8R43DRAFT_963973 [Mycena crocata]|nr:hypothetical protein C8R43DRAFT_963973 [Mycena crocata]